MKPWRLKQQRLKALAAQEASMTGNGQGNKPLTPEQIAQQIQQQRAMAAGMAAQQRQAIATGLLSGILSGLYSNPELLAEEFGDKAVNDALAFADKLQARIIADGQKELAKITAAAKPADLVAEGGHQPSRPQTVSEKGIDVVDEKAAVADPAAADAALRASTET